MCYYLDDVKVNGPIPLSEITMHSDFKMAVHIGNRPNHISEYVVLRDEIQQCKNVGLHEMLQSYKRQLKCHSRLRDVPSIIGVIAVRFQREKANLYAVGIDFAGFVIPENTVVDIGFSTHVSDRRRHK